jgi:hypothetical protein
MSCIIRCPQQEATNLELKNPLVCEVGALLPTLSCFEMVSSSFVHPDIPSAPLQPPHSHGTLPPPPPPFPLPQQQLSPKVNLIKLAPPSLSLSPSLFLSLSLSLSLSRSLSLLLPSGPTARCRRRSRRRLLNKRLFPKFLSKGKKNSWRRLSLGVGCGCWVCRGGQNVCLCSRAEKMFGTV